MEVEVPLHVTAIWLPVVTSDPITTGSLGAGVLLEPPARFRVRASRGSGSCTGFCPEAAARAAKLLSIDAHVEYLEGPRIALGYAVSAAAAIAVSYAAAPLRGSTLTAAARVAHVAEVEAGSGLGDVIAQVQAWGFEVRTAAGAPGVGRVEVVPATGRLEVLVLELGGPMTTSEMHSRLGGRLYGEAAPRLARLLGEPTLPRLLEEARSFSLAVNPPPERLLSVLRRLEARGAVAGWFAKKRLLVVLAPSVGEVEGELATLGYPARRYRVARAPASLVLP